MKSDFPYSTVAALLASAILTPLIMSVLKRRFPAVPAKEKELEALTARFDGLEKIAYVAGFVGFFVSVGIILQKSIEVDSFLILFGSIGFFPSISLAATAAWQRDTEVIAGFMRFQEVKYGFSGVFNLSVGVFLCFLFIPGIILFAQR
jgi:hypothetical protein